MISEIEVAIHPFPNTPWDRHYGEAPARGELPTASTTTLFDPLERGILQSNKLLLVVEKTPLILPEYGTGSERLVRVYEVLADVITASKAKERHHAQRTVLRLLDTEEGHQLKSVLDLQTTLPVQLEEIKQIVDERFNPPDNFRVRGIFQNHRVETGEQRDALRSQLIREGEQQFGKEDDNIFFLEDAYGDMFQNPDFYEAYKAYGSVQKAYCFAEQRYSKKIQIPFSKLSKQQREVVDKIVDINMQTHIIAANNPRVDPEGSYLWTQFEAIDVLIKAGYPIVIIWEHGQIQNKWPSFDTKASPEQQKETVLQAMALLTERSSGKSDEGIAQQIVDMENERNKKKQTNVIMVFGSDHYVFANYLSSRLRRVLSFS